MWCYFFEKNDDGFFQSGFAILRHAKKEKMKTMMVTCCCTSDDDEHTTTAYTFLFFFICSCDDVSFTTNKFYQKEDSVFAPLLHQHTSFSSVFLPCFCGLHEEEDPLNKNKNNNNKKRGEKKKRHHHHESDDGKAQKTLFFPFPSPLVVDGIMRSALLFFVWRRGSGENAETIRGHGTSDGGTTRGSSLRATEEEQRVG